MNAQPQSSLLSLSPDSCGPLKCNVYQPIPKKEEDKQAPGLHGGYRSHGPWSVVGGSTQRLTLPPSRSMALRLEPTRASSDNVPITAAAHPRGGNGLSPFDLCVHTPSALQDRVRRSSPHRP